ncbi:oxygen-independent coproporphyrinogen III oxidase [Sphingosinicella rhizophila]|uniref:Coproporphyrinogen-III oxidase n=1 Tax=Sphingosinicella rhizophila TaxID=3050082 RepID=A0ABU3Q537_9SPHN|nr:oxygen-independent coproporphyrinogen III oxidase [Sphingosinicella sp. GR2756]MDT9598514.1 oxygen-independent coproporphyrinogen III oxidase [Sphingosinicella sp. GR2756]
MWTYHPELLATPVPRYTSYPTAAEFRDGIDSREIEGALGAVPADAAISLYLHIPFCREICRYCGCNTGAANKKHRLAGYVDALESEIDLVAGRLAGRGRLSRISFGGGSPNAIGPEDFLRLVERIKTGFRARSPILFVEIDPRSLDRDWAEMMRIAGVTRASLGVQTFAPHVQSAIGRIQPGGMIREAAERLRQAGVSSLNFDLMFGLPLQSSLDLEDTLRQAAVIRPDRIALFGYAHVPHLIARQRQIDSASLPTAPIRFEQARLGHDFLSAAGYQSVGFDHFSLPGDPLAISRRSGRLRRNFQGFTDDQSEYLIGLGASAISSFPDRILQNEKNAGRYRLRVSGGRFPVCRGVVRTSQDVSRARIIEDLLCHGEAAIPPVFLSPAKHRLRPFEDAALIAFSGKRLKLAPEALPYARAIAAAFDVYRQPDARRFSNAI